VYEDHYLPVVENETPTNWKDLVPVIKRAFVDYPKRVGWAVDENNSRLPSLAAGGNLLEAINITLNVLRYHYMDRDLTRTGNSIVVVSPGDGVFEVDKELAGITRQRMMDCGVGSDVVSLSLPPLHMTPFFVYRNPPTEQQEQKSFTDWKTYFECPHWLNVCFVDYDQGDQEEDFSSCDSSSVNFKNFNGFADEVEGQPSSGRRRKNSYSNASATAQANPNQERAEDDDDRDFHEVLAAVRPKNKGGVPRTLLSLLGWSGDTKHISRRGGAPGMSTTIKNLSGGTHSGGRASYERESLDLKDRAESDERQLDSSRHSSRGSRDSDSWIAGHSLSPSSLKGSFLHAVSSSIGPLGSALSMSPGRGGMAGSYERNILPPRLGIKYNEYKEPMRSGSDEQLEKLSSSPTGQITQRRGIKILGRVDSSSEKDRDRDRDRDRIETKRSSSPRSPGRTGMMGAKSGRNAIARMNSSNLAPPATGKSKQNRFKLNPFRVDDEKELLRRRTHNRRRWSHVFPQGVAEFKRHAFINWKSLCQPAILPLTTDFFPSEESLRDDFLFNTYSVTLGALDSTHYNSHAELMNELILQRLTQDLQVVARDALPPGRRLHENINVLSMGHRIAQLEYNHSENVIEITQYVARWASNNSDKTGQGDKNNEKSKGIQVYNYSVYNKAQETFVPNRQQFRKYGVDYPWNSLDNLICGDDDKILTQGQNYRRILFALVPEVSESSKGMEADVEEYKEKFRRLIDYLSQRCGQQIAVDLAGISEPPKAPGSPRGGAGGGGGVSRRPLRRKETKREHRNIILPLAEKKRRNKRYEWAVMQLGANFNPRRVFRISFQWLVASSPRIETEVKSLLRKCVQFGLTLHQFPETSISSSLFLHAFISPPRIIVEEGGEWIESMLLKNEEHGFVDDGWRNTDYDIPGLPNFKFKPKSKYSPKREAARQLIHVSGEFFVRILRDENSKVAFFYCNNRDKNASTNLSVHFKEFRTMIKRYERVWKEERKEKEKRMKKEEELHAKRVIENNSKASE